MCALLRGWLGAGGVGAMPQTWPSRLPSVCRHAGSCDDGLCPLECVQAVQAGDGSLWSEAGLCFPHVCALLWAMLFSPLVESSIRAQGLEQWLSVAWGVHGVAPAHKPESRAVFSLLPPCCYWEEASVLLSSRAEPRLLVALQ